MKIVVVLSVLLLMISVAVYAKMRSKKVAKQELKASNKNIINQLEELSYFKYTDPNKIESLKAALLNDINSSNQFSFLHDDDDPEYYVSIDKRHYFLDGEDLFEEGGFLDKFSDLKSYFKSIDVKLDVKNHIENWSEEDGLNHSMTINGVDYTIFNNFHGTGWGEAAYEFGKILNSILERNNIADRVYLISGGNDGNMVILSPNQYKLIEQYFSENEWKPREIEDWKSFMRVE